jgi:hypothetical protein
MSSFFLEAIGIPTRGPTVYKLDFTHARHVVSTEGDSYMFYIGEGHFLSTRRLPYIQPRLHHDNVQITTLRRAFFSSGWLGELI